MSEKNTTKPLGGYDRIFAGPNSVPYGALSRPWLVVDYNAHNSTLCKLCGKCSHEYQLSIVDMKGALYRVGCTDCVDRMIDEAINTLDDERVDHSEGDTDHGSASEGEKCEADVAISDDEGSAGVVEVYGGGNTGGSAGAGDDPSSDEWGSDDAPHKRKAVGKKNNENKKKKIKK